MSQVIRLPTRYHGELIDVRSLSDAQRAAHGLSRADTIVEVVGEHTLVEEAVAYAREKKLVAFDLETTGLDMFSDEIVLVQLGDCERQYLIWYRHLEPRSVALLTELLGDKAVCKAGQNLKFDLKFWLAKHGLEARAWNVADAMLVEQVLGCGLFGEVDQTLRMTSMGETAKRWLGLLLPKDEGTRTNWQNVEPRSWRETYVDADGETRVREAWGKRSYAADDVCVPLLILRKQRGWLRFLGLAETVKLEHAFLPVLAESEVAGFKIDRPQWQALYEEALQRAAEAEKKLDALFDVTLSYRIDEEGVAEVTRDKSYSSNDQLKDLIHAWVWENQGIRAIATNEQFHRALLEEGRVNPERIEKLFTPHMVPDPEKPKKKDGTPAMKKVAYPKMNDVVKEYWDIYARFLPAEAFALEDTESKTLKLLRIVHATERSTIDEGEEDAYTPAARMPSRVGLSSELVDPLLEMRRATKQAGTYGANWFPRFGPDERVHVEFRQCALATGRLSSKPNCQALPRDARYRQAFVPEPGRKYAGRDWSQIEPRILAQMSHDATYMRVFWSERPGTPEHRKWCRGVEGELDLYTEVGKNIGVIPKHYTKKDCKTLEDGMHGRQQSKTVVLGLGYGTGVSAFRKTLIRDTEQYHSFGYAAKLHREFWESVPALKATLDAMSQLANPEVSRRKVLHPLLEMEVTWAETIGGRKRFFRPDATNWYTEAKNAPVQGTGADILKQTAVLFARWCWKHRVPAWIVNYIHDEILVECAEEVAERVSEKLGELMRQVAEHYCPDVPMASSGGVSDFWVKD